MKLKMLFMSMLAVATLASCSKDEATSSTETSKTGAGYIKVRVKTPTGTHSRAYSEDEAVGKEATINSLYAITFNDRLNTVSAVPSVATNVQFDAGTNGADAESKAFKVDPDTKYIMIVANPGAELLKVLTSAKTNYATYEKVNSAIKLAFRKDDSKEQPSTLVHELTGAAQDNFTMINSGAFEAASPYADIPLVTVTNIEVVGEGKHPTEAEAEEAARTNAVQIQIERLAAKITVTEKATIDVPAGAVFQLAETNYWTLDVLNSAFFPRAEKTKSATSGTHGFYNAAFYTKDPNYMVNQKPFSNRSGLAYNNLVAITLEPNTTWLAKEAFDYAIENTMDKDAQLFKNATRVIVRAKYWPADVVAAGNSTKDWFRYGTKNYANLAALQAEYTKIYDFETAKAGVGEDEVNQKFLTACDNFLAMVIAQATANDKTVSSAATFAGLTEGDLAEIVNGGELVKNSDGCIRWYQNGLNYYYYEIRHDSDATGYMAQDKYGVVRNNSYILRMSSVSGHGTPWYPNVVPPEDNPTNSGNSEYDPEGDKDDGNETTDPIPDPEDEDNPTPKPDQEIDKLYGHMAFDVTVAKWIKWEQEMPLSK